MNLLKYNLFYIFFANLAINFLTNLVEISLNVPVLINNDNII